MTIKPHPLFPNPDTDLPFSIRFMGNESQVLQHLHSVLAMFGYPNIRFERVKRPVPQLERPSGKMRTVLTFSSLSKTIIYTNKRKHNSRNFLSYEDELRNIRVEIGSE